MNWMATTARAALLAAPLAAIALTAQAADILGTIKEQQQFSILAKALESAGMEQSLQGEGPYTVFAPTDQAFEQLPDGALDTLMKQENQEQLKSLLQYHVVEGKQLMAKDAIGSQTDVETLGGDRLSVDGTGQMVLLVPTGLTVTRVGDQVLVERDVTAVTAPAVEVGPAGQAGQQAQQGDVRTQTAEQSGMPATEHQQEVLATEPPTEQQQTMPQDSGMPSTPHQEQVLEGQQAGEQQDVQQAAGEGAAQRDKGILREATVVEPDIQADNGVIHAIDAVLVPQSVLSTIEQSGS